MAEHAIKMVLVYSMERVNIEILRTNACSRLIEGLRDSHLRVICFEYRLVLGYIPVLLSSWNVQMNNEMFKWATATFFA
jgi:hypothetical protein